MTLVEYLGRIATGLLMLAKAFKCAPESGILGESLSIHLGGFLTLDLSLIDLAKEV
jgi:hypothetical protein